MFEISALFFGGKIRQWWLTLTREQKANYVTWLTKWGIFTVVPGTYVFCKSINYYCDYNKVINPYNGFPTLMLYSIKELNDLSDWVTKIMVDDFGASKKLIQDADNKIINKIFLANNFINEVFPWQVFVVDSNDMNAFCLPNGSIFVYTGLSRKIKEEDVMILIIGHEIAHCLLNHAMINLSYDWIFNIIDFFPRILGNAFLTYQQQFFFDLFFQLTYSLTQTLPRRRKLELEADSYGAVMAVEAGVKASEFNKLWTLFEEYEPDPTSKLGRFLSILSTHPLSNVRRDNLIQFIEDN
ncbi:metalloendopeptidase OMA1, mitochondrial-like [Daktulosphaira vitifoliae]|uniref:metalloendopeptidase OMA1, mitochondrial-like n=1 Tax=Daktulosphaira vitifoliae TaxID=58002 RepID=UPI0021A9F35F|nr:metalloendopeptidase OMA1, mitochondrial-like [Daktulosphaira vitifoliae]